MTARACARLLAITLLAYLAIATFPQPPHDFEPGYDRSFLLGLSAAHAQGLVFGEQFIYPYGPLAWLVHPLSLSGAVGTGVLLQLVVYGLFLTLLALLALRAPGTWTGVWCLGVVGAACLIDPLGFWLSHLDAALSVTALLAFVTPAARRMPGLLLLAALAAAMALVKLDGATPALVLCAGLALGTAWQLRKDRGAVARLLLLPPATFLATLVLLFLAECGTVSAVPAFLVTSVRMMLGYKEMSVDGPPGHLVLMLSAFGAVFLLLPLLVRERRRLLAALALILVPCFLLWMRVAMRQDVGHQTACLPRLGLLLLFPLLALTSLRDRIAVGALQLVVLGAGAGFVLLKAPEEQPALLARLSGRQLLQTAAALADWERTTRDLAAKADGIGDMQRLGQQAAALVAGATVDVVPYRIERVMTSGWRWQGRPVPQDSNAYSPPLDGLNAAHFAGEAAPRFVVADPYTIDVRHPFFEAPLGWRALLDRYDVRYRLPETLLLERRSQPRFDPPVALLAQEAHWDQDLALPKSPELLLLSCRIEPSWSGRLVGALYRNAPVFLDVRYGSGAEIRWRTVWPNLASGVLISHVPTTHGTLAEVFAKGPGLVDLVESVRFHTEEPWQFSPSLSVQWWTLPCRADQRPWRVEHEEHVAVALPPAASPPPLVLRFADEPRPGQPLDVVLEGAAPDGQVLLLVRAEKIPKHMLVFAATADAQGVLRLSVLEPFASWLTDLGARLQAAVPDADGGRPPWRRSPVLRFVLAN